MKNTMYDDKNLCTYISMYIFIYIHYYKYIKHGVSLAFQVCGVFVFFLNPGNNGFGNFFFLLLFSM